jgi:hypothetical protein
MRSLVRWLAAAMLAMSHGALAQTATAVEYQHVDWQYYFVTAFPDEIAFLDGGAFNGAWHRTGLTFKVWTAPVEGALPTCRFFTDRFAPRSSHVYTPYAAECESLEAGSTWQYEGTAFYLKLPAANGTCPDGSQTLYRLYNNGMGGAPNHRHLSNALVRTQMQHTGWTAEGNASTLAFACVPLDPIGNTPQGIWRGSTADGETIYGLVVGDTFNWFHTSGASGVPGVVQGTMFEVVGMLLSTGARDFLPSGPYDASVTGTYTQRTIMIGSLTTQGRSRAYTLAYDSTFEQPASVAGLAASYAGTALSAAGAQAGDLTIATDGSISGTALGCTLTGTATPHADLNFVDVTVKTAGPSCVLGTTALAGVASFDRIGGRLYLAAFNGARSDALVFTGTR